MTILGLGLVLVVAVASCGDKTPVNPESAASSVSQNSATTSEASSATVELRFDQSTLHSDLKIDWLELDDSRCPIGVNCFSAGQLVATLEVIQGESEPVQIELLLRIGDEPQPARARGYEFRLLSVEPHPKQGVTIEKSSYVAQVEILGTQ